MINAPQPGTSPDYVCTRQTVSDGGDQAARYEGGGDPEAPTCATRKRKLWRPTAQPLANRSGATKQNVRADQGKSGRAKPGCDFASG